MTKKYTVTLRPVTRDMFPPRVEEDYYFMFKAAEQESTKCPLCECYNGHALSCVKIMKDYIEL